LGNSFSYNTKDNLRDSRSELVRKQFGYLLSEIEQLTESNVDTHKKVLDELAQHINNTLYRLQYPNDCNNRRLLVCYVGFCLHISTSSNRTLVFENDGTKWYYSFKWTDVFKQITSCNYEKHVRPFLPLSKYTSTEQQDKVLLLRIRYEVERELILPHSPEAVPLEFKEILTEHHTNPPAWFMGQIIKFVLRENQTTSAKLNKVEATFNLGNDGKHFHDPQRQSEESLIAIFAEIRTLARSRFVVYGKHFHDPQRQSEESLIAIFAEIRTLARSRFVCRLVYELMQAYQGYAGDNVYSLDYGYAEKWGDKEMISTSDYKAKNKDEIDALEGDIIIFKKQKLNGFIGGLNTRTKKEGNFPVFSLN
uniref:Alpha-(1,6)-fucosyltransferase N- and catalytic domain-containing protein n=2 Tax=Meloidogyne floridensis TaxID=298350 RepID=A0A915NZN3_9BILA